MLQKESRPAVIKYDPSPLTKFYQNVFNSSLMVVHLDSRVKDVNPYLDRGHELFNKKEYAKALAEFDLAASIDPLSPQPWNHKAWRLATWPDQKIRDSRTAVAVAKKAVDLAQNSQSPIQAYIHRTLAAAYAADGDFDQAIISVEAAIKLLNPEDKLSRDDFRRNLALFKSKQILIESYLNIPRIVMDSTGANVFQAEFVKLEGGNVTLKKLDGTVAELSLSKLSEGDQKWARDAAEFAKSGFPQGHFYMTTKLVESQDLVLESAPVTLRKRDGVSGMLWKAIPASDGYFYLTSQYLEQQNQVLKGTNGEDVAVMTPKTGATGTLWKAVPASDGYFYLTTMFMEKSKKVLDGNVGEAKADSDERFKGAPHMVTERGAGTLWKFLPVE